MAKAALTSSVGHRLPAESTRPRVLVVDDVEANIVAIDALLSDMDCELVSARSGNEALRLLLKREFAVMLLDVQMPEMDGYEVAGHARQNPITRDVPIIFVTATHDSEENVIKGYGTGAVDFLFKPISAPILRSKVRVFLELYRARRQIADAKEGLEHAYAELKETQARLVQSAKMASLGELVAGVAHEINNPLAFVVSHLDTVRRSLGQVDAEAREKLTALSCGHFERAQSRLSEMGIGLDRIRDLVVKLRTFSRLDEGELKTVSVRECIESVLTILGHRLRERIPVKTEYRAPDQLECFPGLLNQAVMNLMSNAIDAIEGEGAVTISTELLPDAYVIHVADTGMGIPEHLRERVFEPFFTTKRVGEGTGLGLSITYSIAQKHGGTLELASNPGGGTIASIRIPLTVKENT